MANISLFETIHCCRVLVDGSSPDAGYVLKVWDPKTHTVLDAPLRRTFTNLDDAHEFGRRVADAHAEFPERWDWRLLGANVLDITDARELREAAAEGRRVKVLVPGTRTHRARILTGEIWHSAGRRLWIELSDGSSVDLTLGQLAGLAFIFPEEC